MPISPPKTAMRSCVAFSPSGRLSPYDAAIMPAVMTLSATTSPAARTSATQSRSGGRGRVAVIYVGTTR